MSTQEQRKYYEASHLDERIPHINLLVANKIAEAMADMFEVEPDLMRTIRHEEEEEVNAAVIYVGDGLDMGDWPAVTDPLNEDKFVLEFGQGSERLFVDTRRDVGLPLFQSMVRILQAEAEAEGKVYLPSLVPRAKGNEVPRKRTWLTSYADYSGDDDIMALVGTVNSDGEPTMEPIDIRPKPFEAVTIGTRPGVIVTNKLVGTYAQIDPVALDL
jgi:hypothetical protein